jgi:hypothetical protein
LAYENNYPLRIARTGKYSLKWTCNLESLRREGNSLTRVVEKELLGAGNSIKRLSRDTERR